jgi:hypothetical protein
MKYLNKTIVTNNLTLKALSLIMGYTFWFVWSQTQTMSYTLNVPLCVYNTPETAQFQAPEKVKVQLAGTLQDFYNLDLDNLAIHVDGSTLHEGNNRCVVNNEQLFVPDNIKMIHYAPSNITISYNDTPTTTPALAQPTALAQVVVDEAQNAHDDSLICT